MQGKTHLAVGTAAALAILQPQTMPELIAGTGAALIGSVICDIDVGTSESHEKADQVIAFSILMLCAVAAAEWFWHIGIIRIILSSSNLTRICLSAAVMLLLCAFGKEQPHRSFMHSFPALIAFTGCVSVILPPVASYFGIAFFSHMAIDFLNKKGLQLFYPLRARISLKLCSADGAVDRIMRWIGTVAAVALFGYFFYLIRKR